VAKAKTEQREDFTVPQMDLMTVDYTQLTQLQEQVKQAVEKRRREEVARKVENNKNNPEFKKLLARYAKLKKTLQPYEIAPQETTVKMLLNVELTAKVRFLQHKMEAGYSDADFLFDIDVEGTLAKTKGLKKEQLQALEEGLQQTVDNACERKSDLFPDLMKKLDDLADEIDGVGNELEKFELSFTDIESDYADEVNNVEPKKKKK
jgi:DNA-binding protein H-NS